MGIEYLLTILQKSYFQVPFSWREASGQHLCQPRQDWPGGHQETIQARGGEVSKPDQRMRIMIHFVTLMMMTFRHSYNDHW